MNCPKCHVELRMADRQGVEVDYCPECRGIWLDRGELDKIIERSAAAMGGGPEPSEPAEAFGKGHGGKHKKHKKKSLIQELLDF